MEPGEERDELVKLTANQMHRNLVQWSHGSCDEQKVAADSGPIHRWQDSVWISRHFEFEKVKDDLSSQQLNNNNKGEKVITCNLENQIIVIEKLMESFIIEGGHPLQGYTPYRELR